jgi:hypothetical protein
LDRHSKSALMMKKSYSKRELAQYVSERCRQLTPRVFGTMLSRLWKRSTMKIRVMPPALPGKLYMKPMSPGRRNNIVIGDYNDALEDAQNAALIATESPDSLLRLYESQLLVAEAQGLFSNFQEAVLIYQAAVEFQISVHELCRKNQVWLKRSILLGHCIIKEITSLRLSHIGMRCARVVKSM